MGILTSLPGNERRAGLSLAVWNRPAGISICCTWITLVSFASIELPYARLVVLPTRLHLDSLSPWPSSRHADFEDGVLKVASPYPQDVFRQLKRLMNEP